MNTWKNIIENYLLIILIFVGLGVYTNLVLEPIIIEAIRTETTKIENNITNDIDNKFKKIESLNNTAPLTLPITNEMTTVKDEKISAEMPDSVEVPSKKRKKFLGIF